MRVWLVLLLVMFRVRRDCGFAVLFGFVDWIWFLFVVVVCYLLLRLYDC